jgi:hypothetical protein
MAGRMGIEPMYAGFHCDNRIRGFRGLRNLTKRTLDGGDGMVSFQVMTQRQGVRLNQLQSYDFAFCNVAQEAGGKFFKDSEKRLLPAK